MITLREAFRELEVDLQALDKEFPPNSVNRERTFKMQRLLDKLIRECSDYEPPQATPWTPVE